MFKRLGHLLLIAALLAATGGHWAVLQSVAWTTMFAANLSSGTLSEAVENTFDGQHPCALCKRIAAGKQTEKKADFPAPLKKFEYVNAAPRFVFAAPTQFTLLPAAPKIFSARNSPPPLPPPRGRFV